MRAKGCSNVEALDGTLVQQVQRESVPKIKAKDTPCPESAAMLSLLTLATAAAVRPTLWTITLNQTVALVVTVGGVNVGILPSPKRKVRKMSHQN